MCGILPLCGQILDCSASPELARELRLPAHTNPDNGSTFFSAGSFVDTSSHTNECELDCPLQDKTLVLLILEYIKTVLGGENQMTLTMADLYIYWQFIKLLPKQKPQMSPN